MPLSAEIANIDELLEASEESKQRYKALFAQIADRVMLAREVQEAYDTYETQHKRETKWVKLLRKQCDDYELKQHLVRQQKFDLRRKYNQPQSHSQQQYEAVIEDDLNDLKSNLDTNLVNKSIFPPLFDSKIVSYMFILSLIYKQTYISTFIPTNFRPFIF